MGLFGSSPVADKLSSLTGFVSTTNGRWREPCRPVGSIKQLRVVRDGQDMTVRKLLSDSTDLLLWQQGVTVRLEAQHALHDARFDLMLRVTDAVAAAYANSRHGRRATWTTTRFRLALLPATLSLLSVINIDVCEYLA